jgi:type IV pilus assembly protein PilE
MRKKNRGVTLIELMTVVAIVALLASIAYSSYRNSVIRSNRTEATAALLQAAAAQEKFYLQNNTYADDDQLVLAPADGGLGLARTTPSGYYTIAVTDDSDLATRFQITATPVAGGGQTDDADCTSFTIDQTGRKGATGAGDAAVRCWR